MYVREVGRDNWRDIEDRGKERERPGDQGMTLLRGTAPFLPGKPPSFLFGFYISPGSQAQENEIQYSCLENVELSAQGCQPASR